MVRENDDGVDLEGVVGELFAKGGPQETQRRRAGQDRSAEVRHDREEERRAGGNGAAILGHRAGKIAGGAGLSKEEVCPGRTLSVYASWGDESSADSMRSMATSR